MDTTTSHMTPMLSNALSSTLSLDEVPDGRPTSTISCNESFGVQITERISKIESLPIELLERIALAVVSNNNPIGPPTSLVTLLLLSKRFNDVLGSKNNERLYAELFRERFDWKSVERRWAIGSMGPLTPQMQTIEDKREKRALLESTIEVRPHEDLKLDPLGSFSRPSSPSQVFLPEPSSPWRPFTSRDLATEFKRRCTVLTKLRRAVNAGQVPPSSSRPSSPRLQAFTPRGLRQTLPEPDELTQNLWTCYLMLLENDGKNVRHLLEYADLRTYMRLFYKHSLLSEALNPGWPRQTAGRALGLWIGWLGGDDLSTETPVESDQRFFVLKPYVFGAHKFDAFHAPWTISSLPVSRTSHPVMPPPEGSFQADLRPRTTAQQITHMGRKIQIAPPILCHAAIFSFFFRVEQESNASTDLSVAPFGAPAHLMGPHATTIANGQTPQHQGLGSRLSTKPVKTSLPTLASRIHDDDFVRLVSCVDPYSSRGLPPLRLKGSFNGSWEGRFSFFDFDSYKDMLGGRLRSIYEGPYGENHQVWKIEERIVRLQKGEKPGGKGPVLNAGFEIGSSGPSRSTSLSTSPPLRSTALPQIGSMSSSSRAGDVGTGARAPSSGGGTGSRRKSVDGHMDDAYDSRALKRARSGYCDDSLEEDCFEDEDGNYEILLTGYGHSAWGQFLLKGRIRPYDGMFSLTKEYTPDSRGRWLYRGYCVGGNLVGRWRDTHTPIDLSGYEGTFLMTRRP
ncbi:hypothetical protein OIO90_000106 [Microbotryomycetes sp. JL221]|nr:hypothetical protein OIO90_000106 [Microbotryomycetes sp. JL221]